MGRMDEGGGAPVADASIALDFMLGLDTARSVPEGFAQLARAVERLGFASIVYTAIPLTLGARERIEPVFLASEEFSAGFLRHYEEAELVRHDFTINRARAGQLRRRGERLERLDWRCERERLPAEQREVIDIARHDYGIESALSIPLHVDEHVLAGANVTSADRAPSFDRLTRERAEQLHTLVASFHRWVFCSPERHQHFYARLMARLSASERKVIKLVVDGHRQKLSPEVCGLSPTRTANLLSALYDKLEVSNSSELAHLIGIHRLRPLL